MSDENSLTGRVRRYARVGSAMAGLGARLAGERYLGVAIDRERPAADLRAALGGIKGPLMKVAQLLATIPEALTDQTAGQRERDAGEQIDADQRAELRVGEVQIGDDEGRDGSERLELEAHRRPRHEDDGEREPARVHSAVA